jgi:hypothetical protein
MQTTPQDNIAARKKSAKGAPKGDALLGFSQQT